MAGYDVRGSHELAVLAGRLKDAGRRDLRLALLAGIRTAGKQAIPDIRKSAATTLPRRGGLAAQVAAQPFAVRTSLAASGAKVSIIGQGMKELKDMDAGNLRHPVYGNRKAWKAQKVTPGFFTKPVMRRAPLIRREIQSAMDGVARKVTR